MAVFCSLDSLRISQSSLKSTLHVELASYKFQQVQNDWFMQSLRFSHDFSDVIYNSTNRTATSSFVRTNAAHSSLFLQSLIKHLVHPSNPTRDAEIDSSITEFDDQSTNDIWVDFCHDLQLLALGVLGFGDGGLETGKQFGVEFLFYTIVSLLWRRIEEEEDVSEKERGCDVRLQ